MVLQKSSTVRALRGFALISLSACSQFAAAFSVMSSSRTPETLSQMEATVRRYFQAVNKQDGAMVKSCFGETAQICDVARLARLGEPVKARTVSSSELAERVLEFVTAHPDCLVDFKYGPECGHGSDWVVAHWFETGSWSGESRGLEPTGKPMACEGQTRFLVNPKTMLIEELVVTRTFTDWELALMEQSSK